VIINHPDAQYEKETEALITATQSKNIVVENSVYFNPIPVVINLTAGSGPVVLQNNILSKESPPHTKWIIR